MGVAGKNLFDKNNALNGYIQSNGTFKTSSGGEKCIITYVKKGIYTLSKIQTTRCVVGLYKNEPQNNDVCDELLNTAPFDTLILNVLEDGYLVAFIYNNTGETNTWQSVLDSVQIELGSTATAYEPYNGQTYTIQFKDGDNPLTVYGGTLDVVSGRLTVDRAYVKGVNVAKVGHTDSGVYYADTTHIYADLVQNTTTISDRYVQINTSQRGKIGKFRIYNGEFTIYDDRFTDTTTAQSLLNDVEFCYELATPQTIQLTPTAVKSLLGQNNVWADTGDITDAEYFSKEV